jgi:hypothetical protein
MTRNTGNQHVSTKATLTAILDHARAVLRSDLSRPVRVSLAQSYLAAWNASVALVPASTRRRWRCGR